MDKLVRITNIENYSGVDVNRLHGRIKPLKKENYRILDIALPGDAPKDFIKAYLYGESRKDKPKSWAYYIAKVGHKWYPMESTTEYLLNRIGEVLQLNMSKSFLVLADDQIRFLSKYFTKGDEELVHGANIFSSYLNEIDTTFVEEIEEQALTRELLTFQFTSSAIKFVFPENYKQILESFVKMLVFDAITGNNDRHFYNWGVLRDIRGKRAPLFSPIYDSARGLFWNDSENKIEQLFREGTKIDDNRFNSYLKKYVKNSLPKIGWDGKTKINHFELIKEIHMSYPIYKPVCEDLTNSRRLDAIILMLNEEFSNFYSAKRLILMEECLKLRFSILQNICK